MKKVCVVTPVFNDWYSFRVLLEKINQECASWGGLVQVVAVDDCSTEDWSEHSWSDLQLHHLERVEIVSLTCNLGHQRAIAIGLCEASTRPDLDAVIVMDADGEDRPENIACLLDAHHQMPRHIIVAQRGQRTESLSFRLFYQLYKLLFIGLTGKPMNFGNFCLLPCTCLQRIVSIPDTWNHLAATISKSRIPVQRVRLDRGRRYGGRSSMNLTSLVIHGLSAISVYSEIVFVRLMIVFLLLSVILVIGILIVSWMRLFTQLAIPGWASTLTGLLSILCLQSLFFSTGAAFLLLNTRSRLTIIPILDAHRYIHSRVQLWSNHS